MQAGSSGIWVLDEQPLVIISARAVTRVVDAVYAQRQDTVSNPHGEHAHDIYHVMAGPVLGGWLGSREGQS